MPVSARMARLAAVLGMALLSAAPGARAAAETHPDMTGVWWNWGEAKTPPQYKTPGYPIPPPFTPAGVEKSKFYADPQNNLGERCLPAGGPAGMMNPRSFFPMEVIQKEKQTTIIFELMQQVRRIHTDGRKHPVDPDRTWMGDSVGHWEGDTLVVDTIGVHDGVLNGAGAAVIALNSDAEQRMPYSQDMHLTERLTLLEKGQVLRDVLVVDDPKYYTHPMSFTRYWLRHPELDLQEYVCSENQRPADEGVKPK